MGKFHKLKISNRCVYLDGFKLKGVVSTRLVDGAKLTQPPVEVVITLLVNPLEIGEAPEVEAQEQFKVNYDGTLEAKKISNGVIKKSIF